MPALGEGAVDVGAHLAEFLRPSSQAGPSVGDPSSRGRARAGTLPSSWADQQSPLPPVIVGSRYAGTMGSNNDFTLATSGPSSPLSAGVNSNELPSISSFDQSALSRFRSTSNASSISSSSSIGQRPPILGLAAGSSSPYTGEGSSFNSNSSLAARLRSGSLASAKIGSDPFGNHVFGPSWLMGDMEGDVKVNSTPFRGRGATIAAPRGANHQHADAGTSYGLDSFDQDIRTLDYLGLEDSQSSAADVDPTVDSQYVDVNNGSTAARDRAVSAAFATRAPVFDDGGRARSSSFAPHRPFSTGLFDTEQQHPQQASQQSFYQHEQQPHQSGNPSLTFSQHGGLANASLQRRLGAELSQAGGSSALSSTLGVGGGTAAGRARAISVGMLDTPGSNQLRRGTSQYFGERPSSQSFTAPPNNTSGARHEAVSREDLYTYAIEQGLNPTVFAAAAASAGLTITASRNRAGTLAALAGPGGRLRSELEHFQHFSGTAPPSLDDRDRPSLPAHLFNSGGRPYSSDGRSSSTATSVSMAHGQAPGLSATSPRPVAGHVSPHQSQQQQQQPTRSLWVGNLDNNTTGQELMQAFASYGAIESLRLLPEKECGFVNFCEVEDAIRAREDIMHRLGGRIRVNGTGPNGTVRIGYGKIDNTGVADGGASAASQQHGLGLGSRNRMPSPSPAAGNTDDTPSRALWIGSIPSSTTIAALLSIFQPFGPIESARVLTHKNCGFLNYERVDDAVRARKVLNGRDLLGPEVGAVRVGFAKVPGLKGSAAEDAFLGDSLSEGYASGLDALDALRGAGNLSAQQQVSSGGLESYRSNLVTDLLHKKQSQNELLQEEQRQQQYLADTALHSSVAALSLSQTHSASHSGLSASNSIVPASDKGGVPLPSEMQPRATVTDLQLLMEQLSTEESPEELEDHLAAVSRFRPPATYYTTIPLVGDVANSRRFETTTLRDLRKAMEQNQYPQHEIDDLAISYLDSVVDLASDYIGNTVVQKFFERCSESIKTLMLERLAPHLAMIGVHKNGTWAAQKIIDVSQTVEQRSLIAQHIRPYIPPLLLDQYGNYVVQGLIMYGSASEAGEHLRSGSDFIFDAMIDRCWEIAQGRFGARSMRACLENKHVTKLQRKRVAVAIVLNSIPLATSPNGALLLAWLLDASDLPGRYRLLAPRFTPHLAHLCTHKLASCTVLRIVQETQELEASGIILKALFDSPNDATLQEILTDQVHGSQFIAKVLSTPHIAEDKRSRYVEQVKRLVLEHRLNAVPAYRALTEQLGIDFVGGGPAAASSTRTNPPPTTSTNSSVFHSQYQRQPQATPLASFNQNHRPAADAGLPSPWSAAAPFVPSADYTTTSFSPSMRLGRPAGPERGSSYGAR